MGLFGISINDLRGALSPIQQSINRVIDRLTIQRKEQLKMSEALDRLTTDVAGIKTAAASTLVLLTGLVAEMRAGAGDEAKINALADDLEVVQSDLAAAVVSGTAAADEPDAANPGGRPEGGAADETAEEDETDKTE